MTDHLVPWTAPPTVLVFSPGYRSNDEFRSEYNVLLAAADCMKDKMKVLKKIAKRAYEDGRIRVGDFVTMCHGSRYNSSLVGWIVGQKGKPVSTDALESVHVEYMSPRMVLPSHLVPADADPIQLFASLLMFAKYLATAIVALPDDNRLLRSLGLRPVEGHAYLLVAADDELRQCMSADLSTPVGRLIQRESYKAKANDTWDVYCITLVPDTLRASDYWECDSDDLGVGGEVLFASRDGTTWVGPHSHVVAWTVLDPAVRASLDAAADAKAREAAEDKRRAVARTMAFKEELLERRKGVGAS